MNKILLRIHYQFLVNFGTILDPIWDHFGRVWGPFWEMLASKFHPRTLPNPFHDQFSLIICAWIEFSSILEQFGTNFKPIFDPNEPPNGHGPSQNHPKTLPHYQLPLTSYQFCRPAGCA